MIDGRKAQLEGHGDAVAYLLGALDAAGRARFEAHSAGCAECQRELAELQPVIDDLALSAEQVTPPAHVRQRLLTRAHLTSLQPDAPVPAPQPVPPSVPEPVTRMPRWAAAVMAASLVAAMASTGYAVVARQQVSEAGQSAEYAAAQLADTLQIVYQPNMVAKPLSGMDAAPQATGKVVLAPDRNKAVVIAYSLPQINPDQSYQCWLTTQENGRVDGGTFRPDQSGKAYWVVRAPEMMARYRWMGVTLELGKGAKVPQGPRIRGGSL